MRFIRAFQRLVRRISFRFYGIKVWGNCNIYPTAYIGYNCSIGYGCEIGNNVVIAEGARIGAMSYIPEGVYIGQNCFIGPRFCGTNDKYPPSDKSKWQLTLICEGARIGASVTVLPGVRIGKGSIIGAGSVVTKNVPAGEIWAGVPARKIRKIK